MTREDEGIRPLTADDWQRVRAIYEAGIATGDATFETAAPSWEAWDAGHLRAPRLVATDGQGGAVVGWAAVGPVSGRCVYGGVAEVSVYVDPDARGRGVGRRLLAALVAASEAAGLWTLQAGIFPENGASVAIHLQAGFRIVGTRERLGRMGARWRDVLLLERRSAIVEAGAAPAGASAPPAKVRLADKLASFGDHWHPRIVGDVADCQVKLVKLQGEFVWHRHQHEDEMFLVVAGRLTMRLRTGDVVLEPGEMIVIPKGVEHCPAAAEEVHCLLVEPRTTVNTGDATDARKRTQLERI